MAELCQPRHQERCFCINVERRTQERMVRIIPHYQNSIRMKAEDVSGKEGVGSTMDEVLS